MISTTTKFRSDLIPGQLYDTVEQAEAAEHRHLLVDAMEAELSMHRNQVEEVVDWLMHRYDIKPK